ncbi:MAG: SufD family Fe-S cluster assembly protein [Spirochaetia bacterium]|jgi:Fe-S cluster assembly scaffold protein SufB|nr:SufD family Fe-S cluster assembly protein [Spirochaetia bacterium]
MNAVTKNFLTKLFGSDYADSQAVNVREDGLCAARSSSENVTIEERKKEGGGITVTVKSSCNGEKVFIPACITHSGVNDMAYTDLIVEDGAKVTIDAGCAVHSEHGQSYHKGMHLFVIGKHADVTYKENHLGTGAGAGHLIDTVTDIRQDEDSHFYFEAIQIEGVDKTERITRATLADGASLELKERLLTTGTQKADTTFSVDLKGKGSSVDLVSRSVAKDHSNQTIVSRIDGYTLSKGHSECDSILTGDATVSSSPIVISHCPDASLVHEAAIGRISGEQIQKLQTLGLTESEAENWIIQGFLK